MREVLPGVLHWTTHHEDIGVRVSSYLFEPAGVVIDPRIPDEGLDAVAERATPQQVVLTSGLHARHAQRFAERFGCPIRASHEAAERLGDAVEVVPFRLGEEVAPGVTSIGIGVLSPDETALHLDAAEGALVFADGLHRYGDALAFFDDDLLGDDPAKVKAGLKNAFRAVLERDFDHLLFAHGEPLIGGGKAALREFVTSPVGHEDFGQAL